ncbi:MAG: hypothetical protein HZA50_10310 [Planctomycetes bacterium]|nr:hypothetical protein [Planctomycetota bacterium]
MIERTEKAVKERDVPVSARSAHPATVAARLYQCWKCGGACRLWQASHEFRWFYLSSPSSHCVGGQKRWAFENPGVGLIAS